MVEEDVVEEGEEGGLEKGGEPEGREGILFVNFDTEAPASSAPLPQGLVNEQ